jgi:replicative DNA helicase
MASMLTELRISDLSKRQAAALKRKARRVGLTAGDYVKQLINDDLALDRRAQSTPLEELAAPFRKALKGASDEEVLQIVAKSRLRRRSRPQFASPDPLNLMRRWGT